MSVQLLDREFTVDVRFQVMLEITDEARFLQALKNYNDTVGETDAKELLSRIAVHIIKNGCDAQLEGCGYVSDRGEMPDELDLWCGVDVFNSDPLANTDIY